MTAFLITDRKHRAGLGSNSGHGHTAGRCTRGWAAMSSPAGGGQTHLITTTARYRAARYPLARHRAARHPLARHHFMGMEKMYAVPGVTLLVTQFPNHTNRSVEKAISAPVQVPPGCSLILTPPPHTQVCCQKEGRHNKRLHFPQGRKDLLKDIS